MIKSVGIDLACAGEHKVCCLDEEAQPYDGFTFITSSEGLARLEERIFTGRANPTIVFEPTGLAWLQVAIYLKARHPNCHLVRVQARKVVALRKYIHRSSKSDKIDALTLAKMPFIDAERLEDLYLPPAKIYTMQRLARQRKLLESSIGAHKTRIGSIIDGYLPGLRQTFSDPWSMHARAFFSSRLNPMDIIRSSERALHVFLTKERGHGKADTTESHRVYATCKDIATIYKLSKQAGTIDDDFFADLQDEISREFRIVTMLEAESEGIAKRLEQLYNELHPSGNLQTIPGVGEHTAPIFLATIGDPARFRSQAAFANYSGVVPAANQSSASEAKGLSMTKAGPATLKWALFQSSQIGRRCDPQLAWVYYREMVHNGKNHRQAMGAVMSHLGARILSVLRENKPYELRDIEGNPISREDAKKLIMATYQVPETIKRDRRHRRSLGNIVVTTFPKRRMVSIRTHEAAYAPQSV